MKIGLIVLDAFVPIIKFDCKPAGEGEAVGDDRS